MSARTNVRALIDALLVAEPFDLGTSGDLVWAPTVDNACTLQLGDETHSLGFKVFLGSTNTYAHFSTGAAAALTLQNVTYSLSNAVVGTLTANTINVAGNTTCLGTTTVEAALTVYPVVADVVNATTVTVNSGESDSASAMGATITVNGLNAVTTYNAASTVFDAISTNTLTVAENTNTGAMNVTGTGTLPSIPISGAAALEDLNVLPAADDGTPIVFGNAAQSVDFRVYIGGGSNRIQFDRGAQQLQALGANIVSDSAVTLSSAANTDVSNATAHNAATLNCSGSLATTGNTIINTSIAAESLTVLPAADDGTLSVFGNAANGADVSIVLGSPNNVLFDRGNGALTLSGVELNSNSTLTGTTLAITGDLAGTALNTTDMNLTGKLTYINTAYTNKGYVNSTANAIVSEADTGKLLTNIGASGTIALTLPRPADVVDNTINYEVLASAAQNLTIDVYGYRSADFVAANKESFFRANPSPVNAVPCSFACWINTTTQNTGGIAYMQSGTVDERQGLLVTATPSVQCIIHNLGTEGIANYNVNYADNTWHHIVAVCKNAAHRQIYYDGVLQGTNTTSVTQGTYDRYTMGNLRGTGAGAPAQSYNGKQAYNETYNTNLNANQVSYLFNSGAGRSYRFLVDNNTDTDNPYDNMRSCYEYLEASGAATDTKNSLGTNDGNTVGRDHTDGPFLIPGTGDFISRAGASADKAYTINTVNGHGCLQLNPDQQWVFSPFNGTTFTIES